MGHTSRDSEPDSEVTVGPPTRTTSRTLGPPSSGHGTPGETETSDCSMLGVESRYDCKLGVKEEFYRDCQGTYFYVTVSYF